jgi:cytochrome c553
LSSLARSGAATFATPGSQFAAACTSCHRPDGHGSAIPSIIGLPESRIVQLMLAYRSAEPGLSNMPGAQIMYVVADALSPREIEEVAHYLAGQPTVAKRQ